MMSKHYAVIMAGGIGSRFWPYSRVAKPKQFLDVLNVGKTLIQMTYDRYLNICPKENIYIVTNEDYCDLVKEQLPELSEDQILSEPARRNTAPCIAYACRKIYKKDAEAKIIISPSDHLVIKEVAFVEVVENALKYIQKNNVLLTLGIKPSRPDTGYGYIQYEDDTNDEEIFKVKAFTEKPDIELAKTFLKSGDFLWNSGIFVWRASTILEAMKLHIPEVYEAIENISDTFYTEKENMAIKKAYTQCTSISIDYAVMEKAENVHVLPAEFGWSDIGTWASLYAIYEKDYLGNAVSGDMVKVYDGADNMIVVPKQKMVVLNGIKGCCIVDTEDVLLITKLDREQEVKKITTDLKAKKLDKYL